MLFHAFLGLLAVLIIKYGRQFAEWLFDLQNKRKWMKNVPGPESLLFVGCMHKIPSESHLILPFLLDEMNKVLDKGQNVMRLWVGPKLIVIPLDPEAVKVITSSNTELNKGQDYFFFEQWLGQGLIVSGGDRWFKVRRMVTPAFHFSKIEEYTEAMDKHSRTMIRLISECAGDDEIDIFPYIKHCALDTIVETAMGIELNAQLDSNQPYVKAVKEFSRLFLIYWRNPHYGMFGGLLWWILGYKSQTDEALDVLKETTNKVVRERMEIFNDYRQNGVERTEKKKLNFLDLMLEYNAENQITIEQLREEVDTFTFAGFDTTTSAISWTIWCLATHPEEQEKLYSEIAETLAGADFKSTKIKELKYLDMVLKEAMRLFAPVPFVQRTIKSDMTIDGHLIPKNTTLAISPFMLHRNPKTFPDPNKFDPERFGEGKEYPPTAFIPFSAGPRNCVGQKFAVREAKIMLSHLVINFKFSTHYNMLDNLPLSEPIAAPKLGIPVKIVPRN